MIWKFEMASYIYTVEPPVHEPNVSHHLSLYQLREANRSGLLHATGVCRMGGDKAGFHATEPI